MKHVLALLLLAAASHAPAAITDNFLDDERESDFRINLIFELARQDLPISNEMVGGAFQFGSTFPTDRADVTHSRDSTTGEMVHTIPILGDLVTYFSHFPGCPEWIKCHLQIRTPKGEALRPAFLKGDTFLIEDVEVKRTETGEFSHLFILSEAENTPNRSDAPGSYNLKPIHGAYRKICIECTSNIRLEEWSLTVGFNNYIYVFFTKKKKEILARAPLPEVPRAASSGEKKAAGKGK